MKTQSGDLSGQLALVKKRFLQSWPRFLVIHLVVNVLTVALLLPLASLLLRAAIALSGDSALSDQDIFFFFLSPTGILSSITLASLYAIIAILEYAALMTVAWPGGASRSVAQVLSFLAAQAARLVRLAALMILRVLLTSLPYLALLALLYHLLLSEHDINYYLSAKPPEWKRALMLGALVGSGWAFHLLRLFINWSFSLPLLLFSKVSPLRALSMSRDAVRGHRIGIGAWLGSWLGVSVLAAALASVVVAAIGDWLVPAALDSMTQLLAVLSFIALISFVSSFVVTFLSNALLSLLIVGLFEAWGQSAEMAPFSGADRRAPGPYAARWLLLPLMLAALTASFFAVRGVLNTIKMEVRTEIMAHRGASGSAPENTIAAIEAAIDSGAQWVEIDVQESADGEVVVVHDSDLKKISGLPLRIAESTLEELQQADIGSWFDPGFADQRIPTLESVLALCRGRIRVNIELKYYGRQVRLEERVAEIVDAAGMADQVVVMSLSLPGIRAMQGLRPDWTTGLLSSVAVGDIAALDVDFLALNAKTTSRHLIRRLHQAGKKVMVWTVNDPMGAATMAVRGADVIITDEPAMAVDLLLQWEQLQPSERLLLQLAALFQKPSLYRDQ